LNYDAINLRILKTKQNRFQALFVSRRLLLRRARGPPLRSDPENPGTVTLNSVNFHTNL
jgi:hypothetical protein